jgi:hypothetical protein
MPTELRMPEKPKEDPVNAFIDFVVKNNAPEGIMHIALHVNHKLRSHLMLLIENEEEREREAIETRKMLRGLLANMPEENANNAKMG